MTQYTKVWQLLEDPKRWCKGIDGPGRCLVMAIYYVYQECPAYDAYKKVANKVKMLPARWNDAPERTHAEVLDLCKELNI